jgi:hypothetical protein
VCLPKQDTIEQPNENAKMKKATMLGIATTTFFYACIGIFGAFCGCASLSCM